MTTFWPGTSVVRSTNNAFTAMERSEGSVFATPQELARVRATLSNQAKPKKKPGNAASAPAHPVMGNLSARARKQLGKGLNAITIGTKADTERRRALSKASI